MWNEFRQLNRATNTITHATEIIPKHWFGRLREWWDSWIQPTQTWRFKKPHMLLQGGANTGKTTAARFTAGTKRAFIPSSNYNFCLQGLNDSFDYILWDDFQFNQTNRRNLLLLMQGDDISIDVKCGAPYIISWRKPIIFTSNFEITDEGFLARVELINTNL
jgi:hypothetical protein